MAAIFNNSRWLPLMRSNMTANAPHHLYKNLKFSELSKFSDVRNSPPSPHVNYRVREPHVSHTGINVCAHCPLHLPKKVSKKPSVNHIGSSTSHQKSSSAKITHAGSCTYNVNLVSSAESWLINLGLTIIKVQVLWSQRYGPWTHLHTKYDWLLPLTPFKMLNTERTMSHYHKSAKMLWPPLSNQ